MAFKSEDGTFVSISACETSWWNPDSVFDDLDCASAFFANGSAGYSPARNSTTFDGLELKTCQWKVSPLMVSGVRSSFFADEKVFPKGSIQFDNALLMRHIEHEWNSLKELQKRR